MSAQFDEALFKQRTREMLAFFKEKGVEVPLTLGYEGAARYIFGAKSWNNLSSDLKKRLVSPTFGTAEPDAQLPAPPRLAGSLKYQIALDGGERLVDMYVFASFYSSDGQAQADFPVTDAFRIMSDESILQLASFKWQDPKFMEPLAVFRRADTPEVREVLEYVENLPGIELFGRVERRDAVRYVRAFRPHLLAQVLLLEKFGTLRKAARDGFNVSEGKGSRAGTWIAKSAGERLYPDEGTSDYFVTQEAAWEAIGWDLLEQDGDFEVAVLYDVVHASGSVAGPAAA